MRRILPFVIAGAVIAAVVQPARLSAQSPAPASPILESKKKEEEKSAAPRRTRVISPEIAAALSAASPKYAPPPPKPPPKPEEELPDARELDKPANGIVRLPKYLVQEKKPVIFSERAIHTQKGLIDIAMKRYITETDKVLNRFRIPFLTMTNEARALAMYAEDERLQNMANLNEAAAAAAKSDPAQGTYILKAAQQTYLRSSDFGWAKSGNGAK
ncbi:MAG: hypothetical protein JNL39_03840 [Opitutaceae bacterium]|nr:hypothetical protein [Opitutaceae bacterium]